MMGGTKISALSGVTLITGSDVLPIVNDSKTKKVTVNGLVPRNFFTTIPTDGDWTNEEVPIWQTLDGKSVTILKVHSAVIGSNSPSINFNIEERPGDSIGSAGIDISSSEINAVTGGTVTSTFSNAAIISGAYLVFTTGSPCGESGTVTSLSITVDYTVD